MSNRLALGTVQFGLKYGVANENGLVPDDALHAILRCARGAGADTLDTAIGYGESERRLGAAGVAGWRVITKLPALPDSVEDVASWIEAHVRGSLERLRIPRLDGLLLHKPGDSIGSRGERYRSTLDRLKARGLATHVGISIYDPSELDAVWAVWQPDIVQAPLNVIDRRLIESGWLDRLAAGGVHVYVRSVFLQGLLLLPANRRPAWFRKWSGVLDGWLDWCDAHAVSPVEAAIAFVASLPGVHRYVIGVESLRQLEEIVVVAASARAPALPMDLASHDLDLLEPSRWRLQ
jgi:aryl-alcohol dehydrogenase-like predicted oxidoreductase